MREINLTGKALLTDKEIEEHSYLVETRGFTLVENFLTIEESEILKVLWRRQLRLISRSRALSGAI